ncbi:MAG: sigma-70 family RNA polymerase sigma factor [Erythrobacter sp.]|nr:MAG: sigma-70 family RNA polymerase sigma factor [Erythrobacter sp.]
MGDTANLSLSERRAELETALVLVADGERHALRRVYDLTSAKLMGVILHIVRDREAAEDVLQEVYLKVWDRAGRFDATRASPITWLCAIARNSAIDAVRRSGRRSEVSVEFLPEVADDAPLAEAMLCEAQDSERLEHCLKGLQDDHRRCIRLAFFRGYTHSELSEKLEVPLGTMKSWIRRGLASLRGCLGDG